MSLMQQYTDSAMTKMAAGKEELVKRALDAASPGWIAPDVLQRMTCEVHVPSNAETFYLDGKPIIEFYPFEIGKPELRDDSWVQNVSQRYRLLSDSAGAGK